MQYNNGQNPSSSNNMATSRGIIERYKTAKEQQLKWQNIWSECYQYSYPRLDTTHKKQSSVLFDGTAPDAVDELAGVIVSELSPRGVDWARVVVPYKSTDPELAELAKISTDAIMQTIIASNFQVEVHQSIIDLIVAGTAVMLIEASAFSDSSKVTFSALSPMEVVLSDSGLGKLDIIYRSLTMELKGLIEKFPEAKSILSSLIPRGLERRYKTLESIEPCKGGYKFISILMDGDIAGQILKVATYKKCPFIAFRWQKATGEVYGRSPVMKALPDIKTANKVVELTLKNASISVTGIWQADDDGVLNPSAIRLVPGAIIPKAVGSSGLQPLKSPGDFNISGAVLESLHRRIRRALLADVFSQPSNRTATEVIEHSNRSRQILNSVFERIVEEFMTPMLDRVYSIMHLSGDVSNIFELGLKLDIFSPVERSVLHLKLSAVKEFLISSQMFKANLPQVLDINETLRWAAKESGIPENLIISKSDILATEAGSSPDLSSLLSTIVGSGAGKDSEVIDRSLLGQNDASLLGDKTEPLIGDVEVKKEQKGE